MALWVAEAASGPDSVTEGIAGTALGAIAVIVPGYVLGRLSGRGGREPDASDQAMTTRLAADSLLVHIEMMPLTFLLADSVLRHGAAGYGVQIFLWLIGTCLVLPGLLGACGAWLARRPGGSGSGRLARILGFAPANRFIHAWGAMLAELPRQDMAARVVLRDGRRVVGGFTRWGRASEDPARHDLYLDQSIEIESPLRGYPYSGGIWLNGDDIVSVEFFLREPRPREDLVNDENEQQGAAPEQPAPEMELPDTGPFRAFRVGSGDLRRDEPDAKTSEKSAAAPVPAQPPAQGQEAGKK